LTPRRITVPKRKRTGKLSLPIKKALDREFDSKVDPLETWPFAPQFIHLY
jgi:hypothetical protein